MIMTAIASCTATLHFISGRRMAALFCLLCVYLVPVQGTSLDSGETDLRTLLAHERNQELLDHLGTRYEVVYPHQIRRDWGKRRGLSTRIVTPDNKETSSHVQETSLLIETFEYKLQLDLELNTKLFAPTLVQLLYIKDESPITAQKLPENCYYHATIRSHPEARAAFQTCHGIRGIIHLKEKIFFIQPLYGNHSVSSGRSPHLLYHVFAEEHLKCGTAEAYKVDTADGESFLSERENDGRKNKYVEVALVVDQSMFRKFRSPPSEVLGVAIEIINYVDLLYRPLDTAVSLVYSEVWIEDPIEVGRNATATLDSFREYVQRRISRISVDATHLLTGVSFEPESSGLAFPDSICTNKAVGLVRVENIYQPHIAAFVLAHMLGHNLGMHHDDASCKCPEAGGCIMENGTPMTGSTAFSACSTRDYTGTLGKGYGACLYNMPTMRMSICGNGVLEDGEQCDCGTAEDCEKSNPCCDAVTCRLIKHAQCSSGPCCRKCKLLSPDHLCRPSKGECDIPEFCDGTDGQCPADLFKRNGAVCSGGLGYCYQGVCPVLKHQCEQIWGNGADAAHSVCFEKLNVQGTPNGNCGTDARGEIIKCSQENSYCGFLQCSSGEKAPLSLDDPTTQYSVYRIHSNGAVHECKARTLSLSDTKEGLVKDGTKCGYQKVCINQTCTNLKKVVSSKCPMEDFQEACSGNGVCTNINTCFCNEGWKGQDCSMMDEGAIWKDKEYYDSVGDSVSEKPHYGGSEMKVSPNLAITVIAAAIIIGVGLVVIVILFFFYRNDR